MGLIYRMCKAFNKFFRGKEAELKDEKYYVEKCLELEKVLPKDEVAATEIDEREYINVVETDSTITKVVQRRKHRRYRINKKWIKRFGYRRMLIPDMKIHKVGNVYYGSPKALDKFLKENSDKYVVIERGKLNYSSGDKNER